MTAVDVNDFIQEKKCFYKGEHYSVRDNGAIFRHPKEGKPARLNDNHWTFGKENSSNAYLFISGVQIHRIVATAFHGEPPDPKYVVDHKDSNRKNNRPDNLRWLSRLENALKNPTTRKKIIYQCGSIEAFLENPSMLRNIGGNPNFNWMRTVTQEEAQNCKMRMDIWANSDTTPERSTGAVNRENSFAERVYQPLNKWEAGLSGEPGLDFALTPWCGQYMWGADVYFPCCPQNFRSDPLNEYYQNLKVGAVFAYNDDDIFPKLKVFKSEIIKDKSSILVMCERADCNWAIVGIMLNEKSHFIHFYLSSHSKKSEADNAFSIKKGLKNFWSDGYGGILNDFSR